MKNDFNLDENAPVRKLIREVFFKYALFENLLEPEEEENDLVQSENSEEEKKDKRKPKKED